MGCIDDRKSGDSKVELKAACFRGRATRIEPKWSRSGPKLFAMEKRWIYSVGIADVDVEVDSNDRDKVSDNTKDTRRIAAVIGRQDAF